MPTIEIREANATATLICHSIFEKCLWRRLCAFQNVPKQAWFNLTTQNRSAGLPGAISCNYNTLNVLHDRGLLLRAEGAGSQTLWPPTGIMWAWIQFGRLDFGYELIN